MMHPNEILLVVQGSASGAVLPTRAYVECEKEAPSLAHVAALNAQVKRQLVAVSTSTEGR